MQTLAYTDPHGRIRPSPTLEELRAAIFDATQEDYGDGGGGDLSWIKTDPTRYILINGRPSLSFSLIEPYGFCFFFRDGTDQRQQLTYDGSGLQPRVPSFSGGEPTYLPQACYVSRDLAWQIVQDFIRTQQPSPLTTWTFYDKMGFDMGDPGAA